mmetsp:Transcript_21067/g.63051  ORF Transcript_21067/g.63051 Transcript_21067/m.63051 type:complete len:206 (-) Transcript_21067:626-1243(-)
MCGTSCCWSTTCLRAPTLTQRASASQGSASAACMHGCWARRTHASRLSQRSAACRALAGRYATTHSTTASPPSQRSLLPRVPTCSAALWMPAWCMRCGAESHPASWTFLTGVRRCRCLRRARCLLPAARRTAGARCRACWRRVHARAPRTCSMRQSASPASVHAHARRPLASCCWSCRTAWWMRHWRRRPGGSCLRTVPSLCGRP